MHTVKSDRVLRLAVASVLAVPFAAPMAMAAEPAAAVSGIEEILVTARRREESLQEVPLSIAALGSTDLEERNVTDLRQVNGQIPNVVITTSQFAGPIGSQFRMRGVPGVVVYQDGAPLQGGALPNLTDIERVEVLRGPQGTLFGRAAIGGAIQLVTRKPQDEFGADVRMALGSKSRVDVTANVNIPVTDTFFVKATGSALQRGGYVTSTKVNTKFGSQDDKMGRLDMLWRPTDSIEARVQYARIENRSSGVPYVTLNLDAVCDNSQAPSNWFDGAGVQRFFAPNAYCLYTTLDLDPNTAGVQPYDSEFHTYGALEQYRNTIDSTDTSWQQIINDTRLDINWTINDSMAVRLIGSRRYFSTNSYEDLDGTGLDLWVNRLNFITERGDLRTGELQFLWSGDRLTGTTGVYYEESPGAYSRRINWINNDFLQNTALYNAALAAYGTGNPPVLNPESAPQLLGNGFIGISKNETEQWAAFSEWTLAVTDALRLTAGIRYTEQDTINYNFPVNPFNPAVSQAAYALPARYQDIIPGADYFLGRGDPRVTPRNVTQWTPRFSVQYQWTPDIMTYLTYSKGAETGGGLVNVNANQQAILGFGPYFTFPQQAKNYEFGWRADLFNRTLRLNGTAYFIDFTNVSLSEELLPGQLFAANADAEVKGFEIEGQWLVTDAFSVNYGFGMIDAEYTTKGTTRNLQPGTPFPLTPEFSYAVGGQYRWNVMDGELSLRADYNWQDEQLSAVDRITAQQLPDYGLLSGRLSYRPAGSNWDVALSGTNLLGEYYIMSAFYQPQTTATSATVGRPREFAINFNVRFE